MVTDTNTKQFENSIEAHEVYLEVFDMCFISYSANVDASSEFFPRTP
jgi:hypothetical protein